MVDARVSKQANGSRMGSLEKEERSVYACMVVLLSATQSTETFLGHVQKRYAMPDITAAEMQQDMPPTCPYVPQSILGSMTHI